MPASNDNYILAIDLGTSGAKVALVSIHGEVAGWEFEPVPLHVLPGGGAEQVPSDWWNGIVKASRRLIDHGLVSVDNVVGICAATHGSGTVPVDRDGNCLMNAMIWLDSRGAELMRELARGLFNVDGYDILRIPRWLRITGGAPTLAGKDPIGHILYIKRNFPDVYQRTYKFLDVVDYIDYRLTGKFVATIDTKAISWMTDVRDLRRINYHEGLIREWGIDREKLPGLVRCIDVIGELKPEVAAELGLRPGVQVVAGAYDLPAAAVGAGAVEDFAAHLSLATSSFMTVHVPYKKTDLTHMIASLPCALPDRYLLLAEQEAAGANLTFLRDNILYHKDAMLNVDPPSDYFAMLNEVATSVPPGSNGVVYTPWIYGERAPVEDAWIRAGFHNLSLANTRADMVRAVLEGVAFNTRWILGPVEKFCGRVMSPIHVVGGGANSDLWCQIHADVLDRVIRQVKDPIQAVARGAAFIAAVGLGHIRFADIPALIEFKREYQPQPQNRTLYDDLFGEYVELYRKTKDIHRRLNRRGLISRPG
jgi:xylulokinase